MATKHTYSTYTYISLWLMLFNHTHYFKFTILYIVDNITFVKSNNINYDGINNYYGKYKLED